LDELLAATLAAHLDQGIPADEVVVLHQAGSHGPAYSHRYPAPFRRYTPDCTTSALQNCSRQEIVNAYDNTIAYTDHVLAGIIDVL
ncbi:sulfatase-like hydrolase/transferase, partial [Escherichia coli]|uniref:sulfatase-like hydrolase/transferase n=1 Tax=Escherichia coli TaxID=562 RepID=UPI0028FC3C0C